MMTPRETLDTVRAMRSAPERENRLQSQSMAQLNSLSREERIRLIGRVHATRRRMTDRLSAFAMAGADKKAATENEQDRDNVTEDLEPPFTPRSQDELEKELDRIMKEEIVAERQAEKEALRVKSSGTTAPAAKSNTTTTTTTTASASRRRSLLSKRLGKLMR